MFASVLNDSFSPVVYQSVDGDNDSDDGFDGELRSDYDYRYGWSFVACSLAFLTSEASAVFTITAYFRRLEDHVQYTAVDRKPSPDTPPSTGGGDRSSTCSMDGRPDDSPDATACTDMMSRSDPSMMAAPGIRQPVQCGSDCGNNPVAVSSSPSSGTTAEANGTVSKTPPDICPPKIGCDESTAVLAMAVPTATAVTAKQPTAYCSATLNHPTHKHGQNQHLQHQHQHYRQTLAAGGNGPCYEVDTTKPCTCTSAMAATTTKRYATIAGVARHNGGKQYMTTTALTNNNNNNNKRSTMAAAGRSVAGLAAIKEAVGLTDHHHLHQHQHLQQQQQQLQQQQQQQPKQ